MSIEYTRAYKTSDGSTHLNLRDAQECELAKIFNDTQCPVPAVQICTKAILDNADKVLAILSQKERQRVRAA